jgi:hypothetical protein
VEADHGVEAKRLRSFARAVDYILADQEFLRESFHLAVHDFIEHQRQHLEKEERLLFPAAVKAIVPPDVAKRMVVACSITSYSPLILSVAGQCAHLRILADPLSVCVCDVCALQREGMDRAIGRSAPLPSLRFQRDRAERRQGDRRIA